MPRLLKRIIRAATGIPVVSSALRRANSGPVVLFYHGVEKRPTNPKVQTLQLPLADFEKQISHLRKHWEVVSLDHICDGVTNSGQTNSRQLAITFDDGYRNNLEVIEPLLSSYDIPFSVFVSTRHISEGLRFPSYYVRAAVHESTARQIEVRGGKFDLSTQDAKHRTEQALLAQIKTESREIVENIMQDLIQSMPEDRWAEINERYASEQPMSWDEVKELRRRGVTIGSHCHDHLLLHANQGIDEIEHQLKTSKALLEEHVGECRYLAYPNGGMSDITREAVDSVKRHYTAAFTTIAGEIQADANRYVLPRICGDTTEMGRFRLMLDARFRHNRKFRNWTVSAGLREAAGEFQR